MRAIGIDISKWDGNFNYNAAVNKPDFIFIRSSYGLMKDDTFSKHVDQASKVPIIMAYHYFMTAYDWNRQADLFLSTANIDKIKALAVDYESAYNTLSADSTKNLLNMMDYLKLKSGKPILFYTNYSIYSDYMRNFSSQLNKYGFWYARWVYKTVNPHETNPSLPPGQSSWLFWQFAGDDPNTAGYGAGRSWGVESYNVDINVYNGTVNDLINAFGGTAPPEQPPPSTSAEFLQYLLTHINDIITELNDLRTEINKRL